MPEQWIQTYSGLKMEFLNPTPAMVSLFDLAHHLSLEPRYSGAVSYHYSVAQHSLFVVEILESLIVDGSYSSKMADIYDAYSNFAPTEVDRIIKAVGLLHDGDEATFRDIAKPIVDMFPDYEDLRLQLRNVIYNKFLSDLQSNDPTSFELITNLVREADIIALMTEKDQLLGTSPDVWAVDSLGYLPFPNYVIQQRNPSDIEQYYLSKASDLNLFI